MSALWDGCHPCRDWNGTPWEPRSTFANLVGQQIAGGNKFVVWNLLGDWEYFALHLRLPHWASLSPCWQCDCHKNDEAKDWRVGLPGRGWELRDARVWQHRSDHAIFTLPGVSSWNACVDQLHTLEGKGAVSHFLWLRVEAAGLHRSWWQEASGGTGACLGGGCRNSTTSWSSVKGSPASLSTCLLM